MRAEIAEKILENVKESFDLIAEEFSLTREKPWDDIKFLFNYLKKDNKVLDLGCGNGRFYPWFKERKVKYVGLDISPQLVKIAKRKFPEGEFYVGNATELPFPQEEFEAVFAIALLHHIPSEKLRLKTLWEIKRVLKKSGLLVITVWNLWQKKYLKYVFLETIKKIFNQSELDFKDCYIPWCKGKVEVKRYCHAFTLRELKNLCYKKLDFEIVECGYSIRKNYKPNLYLVARKK